MKSFWKIPKEWVQDWGLSPTEALLLSDIDDFDCTIKERSERLKMTRQTLYNSVKKLDTKLSKNLTNECQKIRQKVSKILTNLKGKKENIPHTPYNRKKGNVGEQNIILPTASVGGEKKSPKKRENKYTPEQQKFHGELRDIFLEEWKRYNNDDFNWSPAAMANTIKVIGQIKFKMEKEGLAEITNDKLKENFRIFIQQMFKNLPWYRQNGTPQIIYSKFNEIYIQLKNGKPSSNAADNFHVFGSRNITPDILAEFT